MARDSSFHHILQRAVSCMSWFIVTSNTFDHFVVAEQYGRLTLAEIYSEMDTLAVSYPDFVTVASTQDEFNLPSACRDFETQHIGCTTKYLVIEDTYIYSHRKSKRALEERPDVFLSGALHGDERVGPVAMIEVAKILALAASCESGASNTNGCDTFYANYTARQAAWLARLVSTRRIVILPAPNAKGYHTNFRSEIYVDDNGRTWYNDPNRDFPFDNTESKCMQTIAARSINELFLKYLFQMSMTYHGGIENITFEWGALSIPWGKVSPDDTAQRNLAKKMSYFAGELYSSSSSDQFYETGDMNEILYGVYGGFEDFVYAGSWKTDMMVKCNPTTYGGYDPSKTTYDDVSLSTFNILVEISNNKNPQSSIYGSDIALLDAPFEYDSNANNGFATKHIRTALMAIDIVEPYVEIIGCKKKEFIQEYKPLTVLKPRWSKKRKKISSKVRARPLVKWQIGGAITVDETFLLYGKWDDLPSAFNTLNQPSHSDVDTIMNNSNFYTTEVQNGGSRWTDPTSPSIPTFEAKADMRKFSAGDKIVVFAIAKVDQDWVNLPSNSWPSNVSTQSHMVNIRTDPDYHKIKDGRKVKGHLYWISIPLTIIGK